MYTFVMYIICPISTLIHPKVGSMDTGNSDGKLNMGNDGRAFKKIGSEWDDRIFFSKKKPSNLDRNYSRRLWNAINGK